MIMNKKGFAATGILYTILVLFILLIFGMITMLYSRNNILNRIQKEVKENIYKEVVLNIKDITYTSTVSNQVEFDITGIDISDITNIGCNNGAVVTVENNKVIVNKVLGGTVCTMNTSLETTVNNLDNSENYILMLSDETITANIDFSEETYVEIYLNSYELNLNGKYFRTYGNLIVNGDDNSKIVSAGQVLNNSGTGILTINGGNYERTSGTETTIYNEGVGTIVINSGNFINSSSGACVQNRSNSQPGGTININGGIFISNASVIYNLSSTGIININQSNDFIYINSLAQTWKPAIVNGKTGTINITGNVADKCTNDFADTTSGLCVYAEGDKNYTSDTANTALANTGDGTINVNDGTYFGGYTGISNHYNGIINILSGDINSGWSAIANMRTATTNICSANISSLVYDAWEATNTTTGTINYLSSVIFTNGTNTPTVGGITDNIIPNYTGTCGL